MKTIICLVMILLTAVTESFSQGTTIQTRSVATVPVSKVRGSAWARFSPANPDYILTQVETKGIIIRLSSGDIKTVSRTGQPCGWVQTSILWRDPDGTYSLLDVQTFQTTPVVLNVAEVSLPWTIGKDVTLKFQIKLSADQISKLPALIPDAVVDAPLIVNDGKPRFFLNPEKPNEVIEFGGQTVARYSSKIYQLLVSPDSYKFLVSFGEKFIVYNRLNGETTDLPLGYSPWLWMPDSTTLVGNKDSSLSSRREVVSSSELYVFNIVGKNLKKLLLPQEIANTAIRILDVSGSGDLVVQSSRIIPQLEDLGWIVLRPLWREASESR